jgi:hypothetical protein
LKHQNALRAVATGDQAQVNARVRDLDTQASLLRAKIAAREAELGRRPA